MKRIFSAVIFASIFLSVISSSRASVCRAVEPSERIEIDSEALRRLGGVGIDRKMIFDALINVSKPETSGCWAGASGNFDGQIVSVGVLQWNYGKKSLQPLLIRFKKKMLRNFEEVRDRMMPNHGRLIFSEGCLRSQITDDCREAILGLQTDDKKLKSTLKSEFDALFESDEMVQIQVDRFVALLESVKDDLERLFGDEKPTVRKIKWAIDTKVQQGGFPGDEDVKRVRASWARVKLEDRVAKLARLLVWYEALSNSVDQDGVRLDWTWNVQKWRQKIEGGLTDEQIDLLNLTFLRSRTAIGEGGRWQALTFQRRAKIILGVGSVGGDRHGN